MSIIHGLWLATPSNVGAASDVWLLLVVAGSIAAAIGIGALPPRNATGPDRIPVDRPAWLLVGVLFTSLCVYIFTASLYSALKYPSAARPGSPSTQPVYSPVDNAFFSTVPGLLGFVALLAGDRLVRRTTGQRLGVDLQLLPEGLIKGFAGVLIVVPPLFLLEQGLELTYRAIHYQHPTEHPLLHLLRERPNRVVTTALIVGACIIAPLFEEFLFRGHLQTILRRMLFRMGAPRTASRPTPGDIVSADSTVLPGNVLSYAPPQPGPKGWHTWGAIVLTSVIFASVHPAWSQPIIFVLAICLGYAYERTGNLWVPITIHAVFNTISTALFLSGLFS